MIMIVDVAQATVPFAELAAALEKAGEDMNMTIHAQREEIFNAMHRI
jgi:ACT domain-containing protein